MPKTFKIDPGGKNQRMTVTVGDNPAAYHYDILQFGRNKVIFSSGETDEVDTFHYINLYLYDNHAMRQVVLDKYKEIDEIMHDVWDRKELVAAVSPLCCEMLDSFNLEHIEQWIVNQSGIYIPKTFKEEYDTSLDRDGLGSREQTYIRKEYLELLSLAIALKLMIPIWGEFIHRYKEELGNEIKELHAYRIIKDAKITQSRPYLKLLEYIQTIIDRYPNDPKMTIRIMKGISREDIPELIASYVIVRRIPTSTINTNRDESNMVTSIHGFVTGRMTARPTLSQRIEDKLIGGSSGLDGDRDKASVLETYRTPHDQSIGNIEEMVWFLSDTERVINILDPNMDRDLFRVINEECKALHDVEITDTQITLLKWIISPVISPDAIIYIPKEVLIPIMAIAATYLWEHDFKYFSLLMTAVEESAVEEEEVSTISTLDSRSRLTDAYLQKLDEYFPYHAMSRSASGVITYKNPVLVTIDEITDEIAGKIWRLTANKDRIVECFGEAVIRPRAPFDIRIKLADLIMFIQDRIKADI